MPRRNQEYQCRWGEIERRDRSSRTFGGCCQTEAHNSSKRSSYLAVCQQATATSSLTIMSGFLPSLETFAKVCITNLSPICLLIMNVGYTCHCGNLVDSRSDSFSLNFTYDCLMAITHRRRSYLLRPKLPDIPVCFSSWLSNWWVSLAIGCYSGANCLVLEVAVPSDFELPYQDLELTTSDGITLKSYLLPQKKDIGYNGEDIETSPDTTEDQVRGLVPHWHRE